MEGKVGGGLCEHHGAGGLSVLSDTELPGVTVHDGARRGTRKRIMYTLACVIRSFNIVNMVAGQKCRRPYSGAAHVGMFHIHEEAYRNAK